MSGNSLINIGELAKPMDTLVNRFSDGIGGVFKPRQIRRLAKAEADADLIRAQAKIDKDRLLASTTLAKTEVGERAIARMVEKEVRNQINMEEILSKAIEQLSPTSTPERLEDEFIESVFDKCKTVTNEELQNLWASVISVESNTPKSISKRTLDVLASLDASDAELFRKLGSFCYDLGGPTLINSKSVNSIFEANGFNFSALSHLVALGLLQHETQGYTWKLAGDAAPFHFALSGRECLVIGLHETTGPQSISLGTNILTKAGVELLNVVDSPEIPGVLDAILSDLVQDDRLLYCPFPRQQSVRP